MSLEVSRRTPMFCRILCRTTGSPLMKNPIVSGKKREALAPRREPYWVRLDVGQHLGYRKLEVGEGTWIAKWRRDDGRRYYKSLGHVRDVGKRPAYSIAKFHAEAWFAELAKGVTPHSLTVRHVCERHIQALRLDDGTTKATQEEKRFERLVYPDRISGVDLAKLRKDDLESWRRRIAALPAKVSRRKGQGKAAVTRPRSPATLNRDMVPLRAALNRALDDGLVSSDLAWRVALRPIKNADRRRDIYLDRAERTRLITHASDEVRPFLRALTVLPIRPGAVAALTVADFDPRRGCLRIGKDKNGADRLIVLPKATSDFLAASSKDRLPRAPLLAAPGGRHWNKDLWKGPIKDAVHGAGLPSGVSAYTLRHSVITDLVQSGLELLTIAQIAGTSVAMIEKHYGHLRQERAREALASLAL